MFTATSLRRLALAALALAAVALPPPAAHAQAQQGQGAPALPQAAREALREAYRLDAAGNTAQARTIYQRLIDSTSEPAARAAVQSAMAMSYAFDGDCANTGKYEQQVIDYWKTREQAEPQNAFYQEGEMANEAARVCIDAGDLDAAERWYRLGSALGAKEPAPRTHPQSLWDYRLAHALGRIAARRGNVAEAQREIARARQILDSDSTMAAQQERFYPYLVGYVALYTNDLPTAERELTRAVSLQGNTNDPFMRWLLAETYAKQGRAEEAKAAYQKAYELATAHNPPAAFVRPTVRKTLGIAP